MDIETIEESTLPEENSQPKGEESAEGAPKRGATTFYKQQLDDTKKRLAEIEKNNQDLLLKLNENEEKKMIESSQFKELADKYRREAEKAKSDYSSFKDYFIKEKKNSAIKLEAQKLGIRDEALQDLELLDSSTVEIETTSTGKLNVLGADQFIQQIKEIRPYWFKGQSAPNINTSNPSIVTFKSLNPAELLDLQKKDPAEYNRQMKKILESRVKK